MTMPPLLRRFLSNTDGDLVLWQRPNVPLILWAVFTVLGFVFHTGHPHLIAHLIARVALVIWAILEVFWGASPFRRTLGVIVLGLTARSLLR